ncbi:acyl-CoA dehydrogenase family protein [Geminocystis sp. CENA526]|uniref:acyl-CoA dehydrogenase family protein n=1 Tax=Geminocystis sp. CENA526 TaxID=1355871 RepID=UPI003D6FF693
MINKYPKLVRDKIPEIINTNHSQCQVKQLNIHEYKQALKDKLIEESQEVFQADESNLMEEIADVYEVIEALISVYNLDKKEIQKVKENKAQVKGKFQKKLLLLAIENEIKVDALPPSETNILTEAEDFLKKEILPQAHLIDKNSNILKEKISLMNELNPDFFRLRLKQNLGGVAMSNQGFYSWQTMMAKYSGSLCFLQTQHQSAMAMLNQSNREIQEKYLAKILTENLFCGVGFSHLRRQGKPLVTATPVKGGYELTGFVPWITGYDIFSYFIIGATSIDRCQLYGILPFLPHNNLKFSTVMNLCAMNSTNTVSATLTQWFLPEEDVIMINPPDAIHQKDEKNVLHNGFFALGCAQGALKILEDNSQKLQLAQVNDTYNQLKTEIEDLQQNMFNIVDDEAIDFRQKLTLRVKAINLAFRSSIVAIISSKGQANQENHPANRYYREALVYSVSGQTIPILQESLILNS